MYHELRKRGTGLLLLVQPHDRLKQAKKRAASTTPPAVPTGTGGGRNGTGLQLGSGAHREEREKVRPPIRSLEEIVVNRG